MALSAAARILVYWVAVPYLLATLFGGALGLDPPLCWWSRSCWDSCCKAANFYGHYQHNQNLLWVVIILAASPCADVPSVDAWNMQADTTDQFTLLSSSANLHSADHGPLLPLSWGVETGFGSGPPGCK